jgi:hypothetical protein
MRRHSVFHFPWLCTAALRNRSPLDGDDWHKRRIQSS